MKKPRALIFCLFSSCLLLAGCTDADWDHVMNFGGPKEDVDATPAAAPQPQPQAANVPAAAAADPAGAEFCRGVAAQDASQNDFDLVTQKRVFAQSYAQCLTIYAR
jgi:hypothetical protein